MSRHITEGGGDKPSKQRDTVMAEMTCTIQLVQVCEARLHNTEAILADIVDGLVVSLGNWHQYWQPHKSQPKIRNNPHAQALCVW